LTPVELANPRKKVFEERGKIKSVAIRQVDAFTETCLTGNPAGVVAVANGLTDEQMQLIAREMFVSETAFFLSPSVPGADLRVRWFTPETEVPLCGHATIGGFHVLAEDSLHGMKQAGTYDFQLETKSGVFPIRVIKADSSIDVMLGLTPPRFSRAGQYKLDVLRFLNINLDQIENRMPIVSTDYLFVPVRRLHTIFAMKPDFTNMERFLRNRKLSGLCVFTTETVDKTSAFHSRFFAPSVGINEDPVTGSSNGPLGAYLIEFGKMKLQDGPMVMIGEQGDVIGRRGRVTVEMFLEGNAVKSLAIAGRAVTVMKGEILIP
jgi:PhzF family phenazine biosynthesis protein